MQAQRLVHHTVLLVCSAACWRNHVHRPRVHCKCAHPPHCRSLGCLDAQCVLCEHNPHRRCSVNFSPKYLVNDVLKASDAGLSGMLMDALVAAGRYLLSAASWATSPRQQRGDRLGCAARPLLQAKCEAPIRVELIDRATGQPISEDLPDVVLEVRCVSRACWLMRLRQLLRGSLG